MLVIPAIDLKDGKCVRLRQGRMNEATIFSDDPVAMARRWVDAGARRLHIGDLNGAVAGKPVNGAAIQAIRSAFPDMPMQVGGGIRDEATIAEGLTALAALADRADADKVQALLSGEADGNDTYI